MNAASLPGLYAGPCADALVASQPKEPLMPSSRNPEITAFINLLAETGSHYRMGEMEALYTEDLGSLALTPQGEVARFSKSEVMAEFRSRRGAGEKPLSTEKR